MMVKNEYEWHKWIEYESKGGYLFLLALFIFWMTIDFRTDDIVVSGLAMAMVLCYGWFVSHSKLKLKNTK